jgi:ornithine cyclodeaminase
MTIPYFSAEDVRRLLPMAACIEAMAEALRALARGEAALPLRSVLGVPQGDLIVMPAALSGNAPALGLKMLSVFLDNPAHGLPAIQGIVMLFDPQTGAPTALFDAGSITAIRTAAVSALATDLLAQTGAGDLAILGAGQQARTHLQAIAQVRSLRRIRVWSRTRANAIRFADEQSVGVPVQVMPDAESAVDGADLICTCTSSPVPVLEGRWLREGVHINAVGAYTPTTRELDSEAVKRARLYVDSRESAQSEAGDYLIPLHDGHITALHLLGTLGDILTGTLPARQSDADITLFKSLGLAIEDLAAAQVVLERSRD